MNRSIRAVTIFCLLLVVAMVANLTWIQGFQTDRLAKNSLDRRQYYDMKSRQRGQISAGGEILAHSVKGANDMYNREYVSDPDAFGPVEGYLSDRYGTAGIEASQNNILNGTDDSLFTKRFTDTLTGKETEGANVELTIDPKTQRVAYDAMTSRGYSGAVVALRPSTGEVLALASTPGYDPRSIVTSNAEEAQQNWAALNNNPESPLLNHATQQTLPPGSTFKLITTAAAMEKNNVNANTTVTAEPQITLPDSYTTMENYDGERCGSGSVTTLSTAFTLSCNTTFAQLGMAAGTEQFKKTAKAFGVGETADGFGLPVQTSTVGEIADQPSLAQSSIGQRDVSITPLQDAIIAATIANKGKRMKPYLVKQITDSSLKPIKTTKPEQVNTAINEDIANRITQLMIGSEKGTSGYAGADIASKTGTAEHGENSRSSKPHAWYVAFGPSQNADVAVAVVVENGGDRGQAATGGSVAAPIGRAVIAQALKDGV